MAKNTDSELDLNSATNPKLLRHNFLKYGDNDVAMREKDFGVWNEYSWKDYYEGVKSLSLGLIGLGLKHGDRVVIIGDNKVEMWHSQLAVQSSRAIPIVLYPDCTADELKFYLNHCMAKFVIAEDQEQVDKILEAKRGLPGLEKAIYWDAKGMWKYEDPLLIDLGEVTKRGKEYELSHAGLFEQNVESGKGDDICHISYTSGTTGLPKGAMLRYKNLFASVLAVKDSIPTYATDEYVSFIPLAWGTEQLNGMTGHLIWGFALNFPEAPETVQQNIREISPHSVFYGARQWEGLKAMVDMKVNDAFWLKRLCYNLLLPISLKVGDAHYQGKQLGQFWRVLYRLADWLMFRAIRDRLGLGRVRCGLTGGGLMSPDLYRYFMGIGVPIMNAFGMTECFTDACQWLTESKLGSCGPPVGDTEIRISDEGELVLRGTQLFAGYYRNSEATKKIIRNGWLHSGDAAYLDSDGHLYIIDRLSEIARLSSGESISLASVESMLRFSNFIRDAVALGEDRGYVAAIVNIDFDNVGKWAENNHIDYTTLVDLSQKSHVYDLIASEIRRINQARPDYARVRKFSILHKEFDADEAEITRTRKVRRGFMGERYSSLIEALYGEAPEVVVDAKVKYQDGTEGLISTTIKVYAVD